MEKLCYVVWKREGLSDVEFRDELIGGTAKQLLERGARKLSVLAADEITATLVNSRITAMDPPISGMLSLWVDLADDRGPVEEVIDRVSARKAGYLVVESVPLLNTTRIAPLGQRTPGTTLLTLIKQTPRLSYEAWLEHWHSVQKKVALETQCTYLYVRNVIVRPLTPNAPDFQGIVEEGFPTEAVTDPMLWYCTEGSKQKLEENLGRMMESCRAFLDLEEIESHPMSEYHIAV